MDLVEQYLRASAADMVFAAETESARYVRPGVLCYRDSSCSYSWWSLTDRKVCMAHDTMHGRCSCNGFAHVALDSVAQGHGPVRRSSLPCVTRRGTSIFGDFPKCSETKSDCLKQLDPVITVTSSFAYQYGERMRSATIHNGFSAGLNVSLTGRLDCIGLDALSSSS